LSDVNSSSTTSNEPVVSESIDESLTEQTAEPINENFDTEINTAHIEEAVGEQEHLNTRPSSLGPVPTIITPNGDGINDHFIFPTENIAEIQINIYDSRGSLLLNYEGDANWHWDGTLKNGQPAPNGNYYFAVYARGYDNKMHQEKGSLYINR
jgi:gliding motility-associated-like protein